MITRLKNTGLLSGLNFPLKLLGLFSAMLLLGACQTTTPGQTNDRIVKPAALAPVSHISASVKALPPPTKPIDVAVYAFADKTGQNKPEENFSSFSRAVTQGGEALLISALKRAGHGRWFRVVERTGLNNLLQERKIISQTRARLEGQGAAPLPPLRFAGMIIEGGIINYDSNTITGGAGARYLGIGSNMQYREDVVTVSLRTISVNSGEVISSVTTTKTIYSVLVKAGTFSFVAFDKLLEVETGLTRNEPVGFAVQQAIDLAVYAMVLEGAKNGLWRFADQAAGANLVAAYRGNYLRRHLEALQVAYAGK